MKGLIFSAIGLALTASALAQVPHTFQAGQPARAADVNANFQSLNQTIGKSVGVLVTLRPAATTGTGVASAGCPQDTLVLSTSCSCDSANGTRNYGVLFACNVAGNGGVAGCFPDSGTFDATKPAPAAQLALTCLSGTTNDGTILTRILGTKERPLSAVTSELETARAHAQQQLDTYMSLGRR